METRTNQFVQAETQSATFGISKLSLHTQRKYGYKCFEGNTTPVQHIKCISFNKIAYNCQLTCKPKAYCKKSSKSKFLDGGWGKLEGNLGRSLKDNDEIAARTWYTNQLIPKARNNKIDHRVNIELSPQEKTQED